jgi:hypothetical protein
MSLDEFRPILAAITGKEKFAFEWSPLVREFLPRGVDVYSRLSASIGERLRVKSNV